MQDCFNGDPLGQFITYESSEINSIVETESRYKMKQRNCITFSLDIGSYIRFSPNEDKGNELEPNIQQRNNLNYFELD